LFPFQIVTSFDWSFFAGDVRQNSSPYRSQHQQIVKDLKCLKQQVSENEEKISHQNLEIGTLRTQMTIIRTQLYLLRKETLDEQKLLKKKVQQLDVPGLPVVLVVILFLLFLVLSSLL